MAKSTEHCMPNITPMRPCSFKYAKIFPTIDRCNQIKGITVDQYADRGMNFYRDIEQEKYKYTIPSETDGFAKFAQKKSGRDFEHRLSVDEVDLIIREKFRFDRHSLFQLFQTADINKKGFLTKESLLRVMYTICPDIKVDHFYQLLERYNLNVRSVITFQEIEKAFSDPPVGKYLAPILFHGMGSSRNVSAPYALNLLREACLDKDFNLKVILPENCFEKNGIILMPQFREALGRIQINMCDEDFIRLWNKIDKKGVGSVALPDLLTLLNLQDDGTPMCGLRQPPIPIRRPKLERVVRTKPPLKYTNCYQLLNKDQQPDLKAGGVSFPIIKPPGWKPKDCGGSDEFQFGKGTQFAHGLQILRQNRPQFYSIMDNLYYIFEEPYQEMIIIFRHYDPKNSGFVSTDTGLKILSEFGFKIEFENLTTFLSKNNILDPNNGINYRKLIDKFQFKGPGTHVNRMISYIIQAQYQTTGLKSLKTMSVEEIEEKLYKILHKDFIKFRSELQIASKNTNYVCDHELKKIIEGIIGYSMSKCQWTELQKSFHYQYPRNEDDEDENESRPVNYVKFLDYFNKPMGTCRYSTKYKPDEYLESLKRGKKKIEVYDPPRKSHILCRLVADILKFRFHAIDKLYKSFGSGIEGTFTKEILHHLLNSQKCRLSPDEMEVIWAVVELDPSYYTWNYRQILKHLMMNLYKRAEELTVESRKLTSEDSNIEVLKNFRKLHKDDKLKREVADNHKIEMALKIKSYSSNADKAKDTLAKMAPHMKEIWAPFKKQLRKVDIMGKATIELFEMKDLLKKSNFDLTDDEIDNLLYTFDRYKNGRFDYISFLKEFASYSEGDVSKKPLLHFDRMRHQVLNQRNSEKLTITNLCSKMREWLIKEWKSLIRAFRKLDTNKTSKLDISQLNGVLLKAGIELSEDDLYHLFTGFDTNLDGKIDYVEFIEQLLDVLLPSPD